jgi:hypothetical protein
MKHARLTVIILSLTMLLQVMGSGWIEIEELEIAPTFLEEEPPVMEATSPGHVVFAQYITSDNCGYCYQFGSPAHKQLKQNYADDYVYISYHSADFGNTADAESGNINPIRGVSHLQETGGAPKTGFGDALPLNTGCGSNTCWDSFFSSGGNMHSTANDYSMRVIQSDNGDGTSDVLVASKYIGSGTAPSSLKLYAAVTEETCNSHVYSDSSKGGNCWEAWLLNGGAYASNSGNVGSGTGFQTISLSGNQWSNYTWTVPNNLVNGGAGNMNTIAALFGGWSTTSANEDVYHATDSTMGPLVDVNIQSFEVSNDAGYSGYVNGDMLTIDAVIQNVGDEQYADGGTITIYQLSGSTENQVGSPTALNSLAPGATQSVQVQIDSSSFTASAYDAKFRARLTDLVADKNSGNNVGTSNIAHDMVPLANTPTIVGSTSVDRASTAQVEVKAQSMDGVDNMSTMNPTFEFSPNGLDAWTTDGVTGGDVLLGAAAGNPRYEFFVKPNLEMNSGMYDVRVKFTDARGLESEWAVNNGQSGGGAFELLNSLPTITVNPVPTVMVDVETQVSLLGHVDDEETALEDLNITSTSSSFMGWDPATGMMNVHFNKIQRDSSGNPTQSGIYLSVTDEDGGNSGGTLLFNVIENGMPRWAAVSPVTMDEASSTVVFLKNSLSDSNSDGTPTNGVDHLSLAIVGNDNTDLLTASVNGFNLEIETVDDDATGEATLTVRASDGIQFSETTMKVYVQNVNDAPVLNISAFEDITLFKGEQMLIDLRSHLSDADDDQNIADLYVNVLSSPQIAALYSMQTGILTLQWEESGTQDVTITVVDDEDEVSSYAFSVEVISSLPLSVGKEDSSEVDVFLVGMDTNIGRTPSFLMTLSSEIGLLTDVQTEWQICNMVTGLCYDLIKKEHPNANAATGWSYEVSFKRIVDNGGLIDGDQIKLVGVSGVDAGGVDREMIGEHLYWNITTYPAFGDMESEELETLISEMEAEMITLEEEIKALPEGSSTRMSKEAKLETTKTTYAMACNTEGVVCASDEVAAGGGGTTTTMGSTDMLVYAGMGLFAIIIIALLSMLIVRRGGEPEFKDFSNMLPSHDHVANSMYGGAAPIFQQQVAPAPVTMSPGVPPVPATGLPAGWTMEQWQYYGHQYLEQTGLE